MTKQQENDRRYAIALLLKSVDNLARDLAIKIDTDPNHLVYQSMLRASLALQYQGVTRSIQSIENDYGWLIDQIENLIY